MRIVDVKKYILVEGLKFGNREKRMVDKMSRDIFLGFEFEFNIDADKLIKHYNINTLENIESYTNEELSHIINNNKFPTSAWYDLYNNFFLKFHELLDSIFDNLTKIKRKDDRDIWKETWFNCHNILNIHELFYDVQDELKRRYDPQMVEKILLNMSFYTAGLVLERLIFESKYSHLIKKGIKPKDVEENYDNYIGLVDELYNTLLKMQEFIPYDASSFHNFVRSVLLNTNIIKYISDHILPSQAIKMYAPTLANDMIENSGIKGTYVDEASADAEVVHEHEQFNYSIKTLKRFLNEMKDNPMVYTGDNTGLHCNISIKNTKFTRNDINRLKLTVLMQERKIDPEFPEREYVDSMTKAISKNMSNYDWELLIEYAIKGNWERVFNIIEVAIPTNEKYQRINFQYLAEDMDTRRIEFRFPGDKDYEYKYDTIVDWLYRMVYMTMAAYSDDFGWREFIKEAYKFLDERIVPYNFKKFNFEQLVDYYIRTNGLLPDSSDEPYKNVNTRIRLP